MRIIRGTEKYDEERGCEIVAVFRPQVCNAEEIINGIDELAAVALLMFVSPAEAAVAQDQSERYMSDYNIYGVERLGWRFCGPDTAASRAKHKTKTTELISSRLNAAAASL